MTSTAQIYYTLITATGICDIILNSKGRRSRSQGQHIIDGIQGFKYNQLNKRQSGEVVKPLCRRSVHDDVDPQNLHRIQWIRKLH